jgi:transposase-like protein
MNLPELIENFGTEAKCIEALAQLRWPNGIRCPKCESTEIGRIETRSLFQCNACEYQFSVRVGTVLQDSKLPLWKWFLATFLLIEAKKGMSANQLGRTIGVSYKTAWYLCHRIRAAMVDDGSKLSGIIEADEYYVGGVVRGKGRRYTGNKTAVMGLVQRDGQIRLATSPQTHVSNKIVSDFINEHVEADAALYTDENQSYNRVRKDHRIVTHSHGEWVRADVHTNTVESVWSLLDRAIIGSYHKLSKKHLPAYLDEFSFRFNNRENPHKFRDTLTRLCQSEVLGYDQLIA